MALCSTGTIGTFVLEKLNWEKMYTDKKAMYLNLKVSINKSNNFDVIL